MPTNEDTWEQYRKNEMSFQLGLLRGFLLVGMLFVHLVSYIGVYFYPMGEYELPSIIGAFNTHSPIVRVGYGIYFFEQGVECSVRDKLGWGGAVGSKLRMLAVLTIFNLLVVFEKTANLSMRYIDAIPFDTTLSVCLLVLIALPIIKLPLKWHIGITVILWILFLIFPVLNFKVNQLFWRPFSFCFPFYETNEGVTTLFQNRFGVGYNTPFLARMLLSAILGRLYYKYLKKHTLPSAISCMRYSDNKFTKRMLWLGKNSSKISLVRLVLYPVIFMLISLIMFGHLI